MSGAASLQALLGEKWVQARTWDGFVRYATKNVTGLKKVYEDARIPDDLVGWAGRLRMEIRLLTIGADWCGDVVANIPAVARLAELNPNLQLRIIDRDRHPDLMERFLTNGSKSIPVVIVARADFSDHRRWGPRPAPCQAIMKDNRDKLPKEEIVPMIREWYASDAHRTLLAEIAALIKEISGTD
jgi:hypothetical protein